MGDSCLLSKNLESPAGSATTCFVLVARWCSRGHGVSMLVSALYSSNLYSILKGHLRDLPGERVSTRLESRSHGLACARVAVISCRRMPDATTSTSWLMPRSSAGLTYQQPCFSLHVIFAAMIGQLQVAKVERPGLRFLRLYMLCKIF